MLHELLLTLLILSNHVLQLLLLFVLQVIQVRLRSLLRLNVLLMLRLDVLLMLMRLLRLLRRSVLVPVLRQRARRCPHNIAMRRLLMRLLGCSIIHSC